MHTITLHIGQTVEWPRSPDGIAQVEDLHRCRVSLLYRRRHRLCRTRVNVRQIAGIEQHQPRLPGFPPPPDNLLDRGLIKRFKTFTL